MYATGSKYKVHSEEEYLSLKSRTAKGAEFLKDKWNNPDFARERAHYNEMALSLYHWDLRHGLIEKGIEEMRAKEQHDRRF